MQSIQFDVEISTISQIAMQSIFYVKCLFLLSVILKQFTSLLSILLKLTDEFRTATHVTMLTNFS